VSIFNGKVIVNIREFYEDIKTGENKPGKKGIALNIQQWEALKNSADDIHLAVVHSDGEKSFTLSGLDTVHVQVTDNGSNVS
jgi:hypothetical protein